MQFSPFSHHLIPLQSNTIQIKFFFSKPYFPFSSLWYDIISVTSWAQGTSSDTVYVPWVEWLQKLYKWSELVFRSRGKSRNGVKGWWDESTAGLILEACLFLSEESKASYPSNCQRLTLPEAHIWEVLKDRNIVTRVEASWNTSIAALRVVRGDRKGTQCPGV
jgi:hypothetical protein